ncbi:cytochrome P450 [Aequorivita sublithincola DSM 14238]|uniref:Cytochrome P450 n=1 Tax=Aequorivita sublithincola (strain DSM 14238 / LMG 21431 / ACAM 643 / 9-3) TaxID=746697 RepID=I3YTS6_AEQSU|nr:cytochrome P450 [Aequorivita sublithincola]AFL80394.1 cytochrome P450 [Aequorivita sublithincola DSM 14238]
MKAKKIPSVSAFRFLTHSIQILKNPLPFHHKNFETKGDTFRLKLGFGKSVIFSRDAGLAQYALQKNHRNYTKSPIQTRDLAKYVGHGLLTSEGELWQKQRKLIQPAFHKKQLINLLDTINSAIKLELTKIETGKPKDIFPVFNDLAFQTVVKSLFSSAVNQKEINKLQNITEAAQQMLVKELRQPYLIWWFKLSGTIKKHIAETEEARAILMKLVYERRNSGKREDDLLDMLLDARYEDGSVMEDRQLIDEILILFTAGHETTSNALTFTCELLARNPDIQEKLFEEVIFAEVNSETLMDFIKNLSFTKNVIEESLRLYPPAYFIDRVNIENDEFDGMFIPKNSNLLFSLLEIHTNPANWEEPQKFRPERFSDVNPNHFSGQYFPFGAGPRMCIGNNFAMYEMILAIAEIIKTYKIAEKKTSIEMKPLITLKPKNAILEFNFR